MLIRLARKALGFPSQQKLVYFAATRKGSATAAKSVDSQNEALRIAQSLIYAQQILQTQNSLASLVPNNAAAINASKKSATKAASGTKRRVAKRPSKRLAGRVISSSDFLPVDNNLPKPPKKPANIYLAFKNQTLKKLRDENQKITYQDAIKKIRELWASKDAATEEKLNKEFELLQQKYNLQKIKYETQFGKILRKPKSKDILYRKVKVARDPSIPQPPKRNLNSYLLFAQDIREQVVKQNKDSKNLQIFRIIGQKWEKLDAPTKLKYTARFEEQKKQYDIKKQEYEKTYGKIKKTSNIIYQAVDIRTTKVAPIHEKTGFDVYCLQRAEEQKAKDSQLKPREQKNLFKLQWKELSNEAKQKYESTAQQEKVKAASSATSSTASTPIASDAKPVNSTPKL